MSGLLDCSVGSLASAPVVFGVLSYSQCSKCMDGSGRVVVRIHTRLRGTDTSVPTSSTSVYVARTASEIRVDEDRGVSI